MAAEIELDGADGDERGGGDVGTGDVLVGVLVDVLTVLVCAVTWSISAARGPDQERAFWREEVRKVIAYWNAAPGEEGPDTQAKILALITKIESDLKEVRALIAAG